MTRDLKTDSFLHGGDYNPEQWLDRPDILDQDFNYFKEASINNVTLGVFSWSKLEPEEGKFDFSWLDDIFDKAEAQNTKVILATPSGAKPRWLADKYPEVLRVNENGDRNLFGERHNHCYTSPVYREKVAIINRKLAERYGKRKNLLLWHISNEFGGECYCDLCQAAFRDWVKDKYQTLDNLNHAYWANFWSHTYTSWDQVHSPAPNGDQNVLELNLDWRRFITDRTIDFYEAEIKPLRELTPDIPITTNFMGGNPPESHVHYDLDYQKFAQHVDIVSWDSYPNWANDYESTERLAMETALMNDVMRSLKHQDYLIMESTASQVNWHPFNRPKKPGMLRMGALQEISHGSDSVNYFQLHQSRGASEMFHGAVITHQLSDQTRQFREVAQLGQNLKQLKAAKQLPHRQAKVAIVYDYDNMWALDDSRNYANSTKKYWRTIQAQYRYFWENDIPVELLSTADDLTPYTLVIDPMHFMMSETFAAKLQAYVEQGGTLVGTYITGIVDKDNLAYLGGWPAALHKTYGIEFEETDTLYPKQHNTLKAFNKRYETRDYDELITVDTANVVGTYQEDYYAGQPGVTDNKLGKGRAYYLAARASDDFLTDFYTKLNEKLELKLALPIEKNTSAVSIQIREDKVARYYFVINFSHETHEIDLQKPLQNVLTGETANSIVQLGAYDVAVFTESVK
ncbi:beta-galactosidase [Secundilactobacillus collinoides]|uniref:Beta-galactosidase n=2 Tax=Secundilactobacillus collinoides TaxID=33960 RepID=A0A0R2BBG2_SECCO|nr:beta-galactosidase [Secundilactobacillus collinoides]KRM75172.1 beta-galactosidase i [Secundilactobacillus collinoides DSM 20515 = JCM 1123]KZL43234.1 beta-galactosidase [Secundilactobacillus collinoides]